MPRRIFISIFPLFCLLFFSACEEAGEIECKTIIINDTKPDYEGLLVRSLEGQYIILCIAPEIPNFQTLTIEEIMSYPFSIGKVKDGVIKVKLSEGFDYWNGEGAYWVFFLIPDSRAEKITDGFLSKEDHRISEKVTYISNNDFMRAIYINIDIRGNLPLVDDGQ